MARINLVPWREKRRQQRKKEFSILLGVAIVATLLVMGLWHLINQNAIENQLDRNKMLQKEIEIVDAKLKEIERLDGLRDKLLARMELIQSLQSSRPEAVHMMDEMVFVMPEGTVLKSIKQSGKSIAIEGTAQSNAQISALMRSVEDSDWLDKPILKLISSNEKQEGLSKFNLSMNQVKPKGDEK
jgi:type IV pilus assembly protein PilN